MVCGPKKNKKKVGTSRKNAGTSRKNTFNWKMTSWLIPWELEAETLSKKKVSMPKMVCGPKKKKKSRNVPKKRRDVRKNAGTSRKKHTQLENDVLANPLGVRGSNFVQKKSINAENGLRPKKKKKKK